MEAIIRDNPQLLIWLALILAVAVCFIAKTVAAHWQAFRQAELEVALKEALLQRGMDAEQIIQVLQAGPGFARDPGAGEERTYAYPSRGHRRASSGDRGWLWLVLGLPIALFLLCTGLLTLGASMAVTHDEYMPEPADVQPALWAPQIPADVP